MNAYGGERKISKGKRKAERSELKFRKVQKRSGETKRSGAKGKEAFEEFLDEHNLNEIALFSQKHLSVLITGVIKTSHYNTHF